MSGIWVTLKRNYGSIAIYPANEAAQALAEIAGKKTLSARDLAIATERLGMGLAMDGATADMQDVRKELDLHCFRFRVEQQRRAREVVVGGEA